MNIDVPLSPAYSKIVFGADNWWATADTNYAKGIFDDAYIFNYALTGIEVQTFYGAYSLRQKHRNHNLL